MTAGVQRAPCELLVVGASFAGLACARAAALAGLRVTVLEKKAAAGDKLHTTAGRRRLPQRAQRGGLPASAR